MNMNFIREVQVRQECLSEDFYIRQIPALAELPELVLENPMTFLVGENGSGKSTLLEGIAVAWGFNPEGGTRNFNFSTRDTHSELGQAIRLVKGIRKPSDEFFLRAESFYNVASQIDDYEEERSGYLQYYGGKSLHCQSHGESFLALAQNRFRSRGLYLLDEPEAALSPQRQLTLLLAIYNYLKSGAQFIIATHSPILLGIPEAEILSLDDGYIHPISYEEADCFQVMEMFINNREVMLKRLLSDDNG
ncbi:AAA family ATPase [uncultured Clostridium sp.]|uniref:AAA family ATPase n=1 Tax=uncultured Clostridium sp. TaxID=59620 RepID=UPI0025FD1CB8|nr:AAA family ATPase [uncultured Clostridium sp.]